MGSQELCEQSLPSAGPWKGMSGVVSEIVIHGKGPVMRARTVLIDIFGEVQLS